MSKQGTKYGKQPFLDEIRNMGISYRRAATLLGVPYLHLRHAGYGYVVPKYELREALSKFFGKPVDRLFTEDSLAGVPHYGDKGRQLIAEAAAASDFHREENSEPQTKLSDVL
jgi:hypothetical protein